MENVLNEDQEVLSKEFISQLNISGPEMRLQMVQLFLTKCALHKLNPQEIIDNTFCGEYKKAFIDMVDFALLLSK